MTRLPAYALAAALLAIVAIPGRAFAQTPPPQPEIDSAPREVAFRAAAVIRGHLENGTPGDEVELQRKLSGLSWERIAAKPVNQELRVRFRRDGLKRSASYRLVWVDPTDQSLSASDAVWIAVTPHLTLKTTPNDVMAGREVTLSGELYPKVPSRSVRLEQRVEGEWRTIGKPSAGDGSFRFEFSPGRTGFRLLRATFAGDDTNSRSRQWAFVRVYRRSMATWYGPGFYGQRTACGQTLRSDTLGVANRTLPCGTKVSFLYRGRTITVKVIDRGPYAAADWDLTEAAARRLRFSGRRTVGSTR